MLNWKFQKYINISFLSVFGRVVKGIEIVQTISNVKTNPKTDKPYDDVTIVSVMVRDPIKL